MNLPPYADHLNLMRDRFDQFRKNPPWSTGIEPRKDVMDGFGGYLIAFRPPAKICDQTQEVAYRVHKIVSSIPYDADVLHSTVADYGLQPSFSADASILKILSEIAEQTFAVRDDVRIFYNGYVGTRDSVLRRGIQNEHSHSLQTNFVERCTRSGHPVRPGWGSSLTVNRFTESKSALELNELRTYMETLEHHPFDTRPQALVIGSYSLNPAGFTLREYHVLSLKGIVIC